MSASVVSPQPRIGRKREKICDLIRDMAYDLGPGCQLPTVIELCEQFDVAKVTLDGVLGQLEQQGIVERRHRRGLFVSASLGLKTIGVVFGEDIFRLHFSPFWGLLLQAVRDQTSGRTDLRAQAYMDISKGHNGLAGHAQLVEDLKAGRLHGLLVFSPSSQEELRQLQSFGVPLIAPFDQPDSTAADREDRTVVDRIAGELAARGCRRVACLQSGEDGVARLADALRHAGLASVEVMDWTMETWKSRLPGIITTLESYGRLLVARMIADTAPSARPDALVSLDDTMTRGAITAMLQAGLKPGRDLTIVTQSNKGSPVLEPYAADLIQIELDPADIVRAAITKLETLMKAGGKG